MLKAKEEVQTIKCEIHGKFPEIISSDSRGLKFEFSCCCQEFDAIVHAYYQNLMQKPGV